jgi:hypothetical protein
VATLDRDGRDDELPGDLIIVRQIDVGRRIRLPCFGGGMTDDEKYLATIFDLLIEGYNGGRYGPTVSPARIAVRRALMARGAGGTHKWTSGTAAEYSDDDGHRRTSNVGTRQAAMR